MTAYVRKIDAMVSAIVKEVDEDIWNDIFGESPELPAEARATRLKLRSVAIALVPK